MAGKCKDCEFCFPHEEYGFVCADATTAKTYQSHWKEVKDCYSEGLEAFIERSKRKRYHLYRYKIVKIKIDGRKQIELRDQEGKGIRIKASNAKR